MSVGSLREGLGLIGVPSLMFDTLETLSEALYRIGNGSFGIGDIDALMFDV